MVSVSSLVMLFCHSLFSAAALVVTVIVTVIVLIAIIIIAFIIFAAAEKKNYPLNYKSVVAFISLSYPFDPSLTMNEYLIPSLSFQKEPFMKRNSATHPFNHVSDHLSLSVFAAWLGGAKIFLAFALIGRWR